MYICNDFENVTPLAYNDLCMNSNAVCDKGLCCGLISDATVD